MAAAATSRPATCPSLRSTGCWRVSRARAPTPAASRRDATWSLQPREPGVQALEEPRCIQRSLRAAHDEVVNAPGVAGGGQPQAPRGIAAEHVAAEHPVAHQLAIARGGALLVERAAGEAFADVGPLLHLQERRKDLLAGRVQQERGLAVLAGAADRADEVSEQAARHVGREGHRDLAGAEAARTEPRHSAYTCGAADGGDGFQLRRVARDGEPVVALHVIAGLCNERAADRVAAGRVAGEKAERIAVDTRVALTAHGCALGVGNAGVYGQARGLTFARQLDRTLRAKVPGVIEIEVGDLAGQRPGLHQSGIRT